MSMTTVKHVAVLMGGWSAEREVSQVTGAAAADALEQAGLRVSRVDVTRDLPALLAALTPLPDVVFNALHGTGGEDGVIQGVLEMLGVPYTHSGLLASAVAMDKPMVKALARQIGVRVTDGATVTRSQINSGALPIAAPCVVKPAASGSSVGVQIVHVGANRVSVGAGAAEERFLVEPFVPGRELTVGIMGTRVLAVTEIVFNHGFFDYEAKYTAGHATHVLPAQIPDVVAQAAGDWALRMHQELGCEGISRSDFRWDDSLPGEAGLHFLEINTQPGFTPISLVPEQAQHCGISFAALCLWLVEGARCRT
jgi:D-alanine-D-alanine ligase